MHRTDRTPYSGSHPIPKINDFLKDINPASHKNRKEASATAASQKEQVKSLRKGEGLPGGNRRVVTDPTTGAEVEIEDVTGDFEESAQGEQKLSVPKMSLPDEHHGISSNDFAQPTQDHEEYKEKQDVTAPPQPTKPGTTTDVPIKGEKTNILLHPTPSLSLEDTVFVGFEKKAGALCVGIVAVVVVLGKVLGGMGIFVSGLIGSLVGGGVWYWAQGVMKEARSVDWESEKKRGEMAVNNLIPESVEWMNSLLGIVWGLVNPDMLTGVADMLEDVLQASSPGIIQNIRVAEMSQGMNPIRILSMRALPDSQVPDLKKAATAARDGRDEDQRKAEEDGGEVYNLEVAFAYNAAPIESKKVSGRTRNMHMQLVFYTGIKGLVGIPLPIWVELKGLVGTMRLRVQIAPDPPYMKTVTFTLMGIPKVSVSCIPMIEKGINVLNLPMISSFVNAGIATAANEYVAPKSMSLELGKMLMGDDVKKETEAVGLLWIDIQKAVGLSKQDRKGSSDPYITLAFSKYGKPMYSTRVIVDDLNPIWNEQTGILINAEHIKASESLSIELWDSDRFTADDCVGKVEIPIQDLMVEPGKMHHQVSKLKGSDINSEMPGQLYWAVGFYDKPALRPALRTLGKDVNLPDALKDNPMLQDDKGSLDTEQEDAIMHTPPDPLYPSGILSVLVHQIVNLEVRDQTGSYGRRKGKEYSPGMETGESKQEEGGKLPSAYCTILINDELAYRTRTKVVSSKPIFNAGTERFIRDWRSSIATISIRDSRNREHDPLLGVVPLKLSELLQTSSGVTRWFPIDGGLGFGQIRVTVFFRSLELQLPPQLQGWNVGTFEFLSDITSDLTAFKSAKLKFRTGGSTGKISTNNCSHSTDTSPHLSWSTKTGKHKDRLLKLPVKHRYMSPITIDIIPLRKRKPAAHAMLWLAELVDNQAQEISIPVWETNNPDRLTQNYIKAPGDHPNVEIKEIGRLTFTCRFSPGMDQTHQHFASDNDSRETFETWEACKHEGIRSDTVKQELNPVVAALHEQSIKDMRDDLATTAAGPAFSQEDADRFTDKYGKSWEQVFHDAREQIVGENLNLEPEWPLRRELPKNYYDANKTEDDGTSYDEYDSSSDSYDDDEEEAGSRDDASSSDGYHHVQHHGDGEGHVEASTDGVNDHHAHGDGNQQGNVHPGEHDVSASTTSGAACDGGGKMKSDPENMGAGANGRDVSKDKKTGLSAIGDYRRNQRELHRQHRGLMQWKPARTVRFLKDEVKEGVRKVGGWGRKGGREPDVETEA